MPAASTFTQDKTEQVVWMSSNKGTELGEKVRVCYFCLLLAHKKSQSQSDIGKKKIYNIPY